MAKKAITFKYNAGSLNAGVKNFFAKAGIAPDKSTGADFKAKAKVGLQLLNWTLNGSSRESVVPPIKDGILRGSGSVFVGSELVGDSKSGYPNGTPNASYTGHKDIITIGFNTSYAEKMHETSWNPGPVSMQSGDTGNKFIEKHLRADGKDLLKLYATFFKQEMGEK